MPALRDAAGVDVSRGGLARLTQDPHVTATEAAWQWDQGRYRPTARLDGPDLALSIQARDAGPSPSCASRPPPWAVAPALPLAEGHYIPGDDPQWRDFLLQELAEFDIRGSQPAPVDDGSRFLHAVVDPGEPLQQHGRLSA